MPAYEPAEKVNLYINSTFEPMEGETVYISIKVSDTSSYLQVPKEKQQPSLREMVFLEKEVKHMNWAIDEFQYSSEYLNYEVEEKEENKGSLDAYLAIQSWRRFQLLDQLLLTNKIDGLEDKSDEMYVFEYLRGEKKM
jgi:hypothetical protein